MNLRISLFLAGVLSFVASFGVGEDKPTQPSATPPAAEFKPDPVEEQAVERVRSVEAARLNTEIAAIRAESAQQLEAKIAAAQKQSNERLGDEIVFLRARMHEERLGVISLDPRSSSSMRVPRKVDKTQTIERVLLLLPGGPLVMELSVTVDGKPYQTESEQILDEMLAVADVNEDGRVTWEEALALRAFQIGPLVRDPSALAADKLAGLIKQFDANHDGAVGRAEARLMLAVNSGGPAFSVQTFSGQQRGNAYIAFDDGQIAASTATTAPKSPIETLLDMNTDGLLTRRDLLAASWRLKLRDKNDDDAIAFAELFDSQQGIFAAPRRVRQNAAPAAPLVWQLGAAADWEGLWKALQERYARDGRLSADGMPDSRTMLAALDKNGDSLLDREELPGLMQAEAQLSANANCGNAGEKVESLVVTSRLAEAPKGAADLRSQSFAIELPGVRLAIVPDMMRDSWREIVARQVKSQMESFDIDKNGYIEERELPEELKKNFAPQLKTWDANADGKVYPDELLDFMVRTQRPQWSRVSLGAMLQDHPIFFALDANNDGQLGLRELEAANRQLTKFDANDDGRLTSGEIPVSIRLAIGRVNYVNQLLQSPTGNFFGQFTPAPQAYVRESAGPSWFSRMDINDDGDVSRREFLGPTSFLETRQKR